MRCATSSILSTLMLVLLGAASVGCCSKGEHMLNFDMTVQVEPTLRTEDGRVPSYWLYIVGVREGQLSTYQAVDAAAFSQADNAQRREAERMNQLVKVSLGGETATKHWSSADPAWTTAWADSTHLAMYLFVPSGAPEVSMAGRRLVLSRDCTDWPNMHSKSKLLVRVTPGGLITDPQPKAK